MTKTLVSRQMTITLALATALALVGALVAPLPWHEAKAQTCGDFVLTWGSPGTGNGQFTDPANGLATDASGNVYVGDGTAAGPYRIQKFDSGGNYLTTIVNVPSGWVVTDIDIDTVNNVIWAGYRQIGTSNDELRSFDAGTGAPLITISDPSIRYVRNMVVDSSAGLIYAIDSDWMQVLSVGGSFLRQWGVGNGQGVTLDANGDVWVKVSFPAELRKYDTNGVLLDTIPNVSGYDIAMGDGDILYVGNPPGFVDVYDVSSKTKFATFGGIGTGNGEFSGLSPWLIARSGVYLYAIDRAASRVQKFYDDCTPAPPPVDTDGDGIYDDIDLDWENHSDEFDDGSGFGIIIERGDLIFDIRDDPANGYTISVSGGTGGEAIISFCDDAVWLSMFDGDSASITCGTATVTATSGDIKVRKPFYANYTFQTLLPQGQTVTFEPILASVNNSQSLEIEIIDLDELVLGQCTLNPGDEIKITFPGGDAVLFTNVGPSDITCTMDENSFTLTTTGKTRRYLDACPGVEGTSNGCPDDSGKKVPLCHKTSSTVRPYRLLYVSHNAVDTHLDEHGDTFDLNVCTMQASMVKNLVTYLPLLGLAALGLAVYIPRRKKATA